MFIDSHAHLDGASFKDDAAEVLGRARQAGLTHIVCIGASEGFDSNRETVELVEPHDWLSATVGIHPHDAAMVDDAIEARVAALAEHPKVVAIGEIGLDYHYDHSPRDAQREAFRRFLRLAKRRSLPIVVHTREAEDDTMAIMDEEGARDVGGVLHCFTGTARLAEHAIDSGFYVSFSGVLTFRTAEPLREIAKRLPRDRVLVETDCPYLAPVPLRGKRNEPSFIVHTAEKLAELWETDLETVKRTTAENAARLFRLGPRAG